MTVQPIRRTHVLILYSLIATSMVITGCQSAAPAPQRPAFIRGIRIHQDEAITFHGIPIPVPRCPVEGVWLAQVGGPSPNSGGTVRYQGSTDQYGDHDHRDALDNANWAVFSGPATAPPCPRATVQRLVPPGGAIFNFICFAAGA